MGSRSRSSFRASSVASSVCRMQQLYDTRKERGCLLDALSRAIKARGRGLTRNFAYQKIRSAMMSERDDACDPSDVILQESSDVDVQCKHKLSKEPKRMLQFSDGMMEECESEDEVNMPENNKSVSQVDSRDMKWLPWAWYQTTWFSSKMLGGCDYVGEFLANFFGVTTPKYQFEINEYYRLQALEKEMRYMQDMEMDGWEEQKKDVLINNENISSVEYN